MGEFSRIYKSDITDRQMKDFWRMAQAAGRDRIFAFDVPPQSGDDFVEWMRRPDMHPWAILFRGVPAGLFLLDKVQGKTAHVHFLTLPCGTHRTGTKGISVVRGMGLYALGSALWEASPTSFRLDTLIGITPSTNSRALHYIRTLGAVDCGVVPGMCYFDETHENVPGVVTIYTRAAIPEWTAAL